MVANVWGALMGSDESPAHNHRLDTSDLKGRWSWLFPLAFRSVSYREFPCGGARVSNWFSGRFGWIGVSGGSHA